MPKNSVQIQEKINRYKIISLSQYRFFKVDNDENFSLLFMIKFLSFQGKKKSFERFLVHFTSID